MNTVHRVSNGESGNPCVPLLSRSVAIWLVAAVMACTVVAQDSRPAAERPVDARRAIREGNQLFIQKKFADALERYKSLDAPPDEVSAELLHNRAAALYRLGDLDGAREAWTRAASLRDAAFESGARYNLGNVDYLQAIAAAEQQDMRQALELLERSRSNYVDAIRLDPSRMDARANLELAGRLIEEFRRLAEEQQQQQQEQQGDSQPDQKQQGEKSESCKDGCDKCDGSGACGEGSDESTDSPQQSDPKSSDPSERSESEPADEDAESQPEEQSEPGEESGGDQDEGKDDEAGDAGDSEGASQQGDAQEQGDDMDGASQSRRTTEMSSVEAARLLQMVRDAELKRRQVLRARMAQNQRTVDKDW